MRCDTLWLNARLLTMIPGATPVADGVIAASAGRIVYAGPRADAPAFTAGEQIDCGARWVTPALIDAHTHLVHAGNRAHEFELRLEGASYEEIARGGGGIVSTMRATRAASEDELVASALPRLDALLTDGVCTIEIKSGYGLDLASELKMLRAARRLGELRAVRVVTTFLGAHALPPEFVGDADGYIALVCDQMLPAVAAEGLADAVDGFCEGIAFSPEQMTRVFDAAKAAPPRLESCSACSLTGSPSAAALASTRSICAGEKPIPSQKPSTASASPSAATAGSI